MGPSAEPWPMEVSTRGWGSVLLTLWVLRVLPLPRDGPARVGILEASQIRCSPELLHAPSDR